MAYWLQDGLAYHFAFSIGRRTQDKRAFEKTLRDTAKNKNPQFPKFSSFLSTPYSSSGNSPNSAAAWHLVSHMLKSKLSAILINLHSGKSPINTIKQAMSFKRDGDVEKFEKKWHKMMGR